MISKSFTLMRYDADEGLVFDWKEPRFEEILDEKGEPTGEQKQVHLYAKTLFLGITDTIDNYIEVKAGGEA